MTVQPNGTNKQGVVGTILSEFPLESAEFEVVTLDFDQNYRGVESTNHNQGGSILTFSKTIGGADRDIVSPIVTVTSSYRRTPIHVLVSGVISRLQLPTVKKPSQVIRTENGSCTLLIITPGRTPDSVTEWSISIPSNIRIDRKILFISKFNMYIGGCSLEQMQEIRDGGMLVPTSVGTPRALVDIHMRGNTEVVKTMYFNLNGIPGKMTIEPSKEPLSTITLRVADQVLVEHVSNGDIIKMEHSIYKFWDKYGGITLIVDCDQDRLSRTYDQLKSTNHGIHPDSITLINELRNEISKLNEKLRDKELLITDLKTQQEELRTKREELKTQQAVSDQSSAAVMDTLKLVGAGLGVLSIIITLVSKAMSSTKAKSNLLEWSMSPIFTRAVAQPNIVPNNLGIGIASLGLACIAGAWVISKVPDETVTLYW